LFDGVDERWNYGEIRIRAIGVVQPGEVRSIISLRYVNRKELDVYRATRADIDKAKLLAELATLPRLCEEEINVQAIEDGDAWTDEELADAEPVSPPPSPDKVRALRARLA
jgi:hypothetical protein